MSSKERGPRCPKCACRDLPVQQTRRVGSKKRRQRQCRFCKHRFWTTETVDQDQQPTKSEGIQ